MSIIVQKYGGSSVADENAIKKVAERVIKFHDTGNKVVVVVSAQSGVTDTFLEKVFKLSCMPNERDVDMLLSSGEQIASSLLSVAVNEKGRKAVALLGYQCGIHTDNVYSKARIKKIDTEKIIQHLDKGEIVIIAGFQGVNDCNEITTLGRGGSDITAVAIGAALNAEYVEICKDVDGIFTADPRICKDAVLLDRVTYDEMLEMAASGTKALNSRSVEIGMKYGLKIYVRSSFKAQDQNNPGTLISMEVNTMEEPVIRAVSHSLKETKVVITQKNASPAAITEVFDIVNELNINIDIISDIALDGYTCVAFTISKDEAYKTDELYLRLKSRLSNCEIKVEKNKCKLSVIGTGIKSTPGIASKVMKVLLENGIGIEMISCSEIKISCIVDEKYAEKGVNLLHEGFIAINNAMRG
ncbi:MAG TPA: aspartate kinase [Petrotogaceae bacterium]|nr:aspartate kinase [Petrotogaceae bacterium]